jgi:predicted transcriptional regulator
MKTKTKMQRYHDRQREAGRVLVQVYVDSELAGQMRGIARRTDRTVSDVYADAAEKFVAWFTAIEAEAWRATLSTDEREVVTA